MMKYMPFRQSAGVDSRQNHSSSVAATPAVWDEVTVRADALRLSPRSPEGASLVSSYYNVT